MCSSDLNLFWSGTRGATLSIERTSGIVIIAKALGLHGHDGVLLTGEALGTAIINLADVADHWAQLLGGSAATSPDPTGQSDPSTAHLMA